MGRRLLNKEFGRGIGARQAKREATEVPKLVDEAIFGFQSVGYSEELAIAIVGTYFENSSHGTQHRSAKALLTDLHHGMHDKYAFDAAVNMMRSKGINGREAFTYALDQANLVPDSAASDAIQGLVAIAYNADRRTLRLLTSEVPLITEMQDGMSLEEITGSAKAALGYDPRAKGLVPYRSNPGVSSDRMVSVDYRRTEDISDDA